VRWHDTSERTLVITLRGRDGTRFALYRELGCVRRVKEAADRSGSDEMQHDNEWHRAAANPSRAVISTHCSRTRFTPAT